MTEIETGRHAADRAPNRRQRHGNPLLGNVRFDSLTQTLAATAGTRRRLLGTLTVGVLGASTTALNSEQAVAKKKKKKKGKQSPTTPPSPPPPQSPPVCSTGILIDGACCTPTTCAAQGKSCGALADGCGGTLQCGSCAEPKTCGGGGKPGVCGCTRATCAAGECGQRPDGCGGMLTCIPASDASRCWVLAGSADPFGPDARIRVDDDLSISVNGQVVAKDDDGTAGEVGPFIFTAQPGDSARVVATDVGAGWRELGALYLGLASGGNAKSISPGVARTESPQAAGVFFDQTFKICLPNGEICSSSAQCCSRSCCGTEVDPTDKCRGGCG